MKSHLGWWWIPNAPLHFSSQVALVLVCLLRRRDQLLDCVILAWTGMRHHCEFQELCSFVCTGWLYWWLWRDHHRLELRCQYHLQRKFFIFFVFVCWHIWLDDIIPQPCLFSHICLPVHTRAGYFFSVVSILISASKKFMHLFYESISTWWFSAACVANIE